ncbi:NADH-quinone oxidoreductase subunit NuoE [Buchnera aphidicola]|uniref:NADH-quinone oxidoreductase subunit NuoE n=1 Tax=Buchnera aphidicola TaxID=9 RepID=UPI003D18AA64
MNIKFKKYSKFIFINFKLTKYEFMNILKLKELYKDSRAASIEALKIVQKKRRWISEQAIIAISKLLGVSIVDLEGVATFYNRIFRKPVGKNIINYCNSVVCFITGYKNIKNFIEKYLNIKSGQTSSDNNFTLLPCCCIGYCDKSPVIMINKNIYKNVNCKMIPNILELYK